MYFMVVSFHYSVKVSIGLVQGGFNFARQNTEFLRGNALNVVLTRRTVSDRISLKLHVSSSKSSPPAGVDSVGVTKTM